MTTTTIEPGDRYSLVPDDRDANRYYIRDDYRGVLLTQDGAPITHSPRDAAEAEVRDLNCLWLGMELILRVRVDREGDRWYEWAEDGLWYEGPIEQARQAREADLRNQAITGHATTLSLSDLERHYGPTRLVSAAEESVELQVLGRRRAEALAAAEAETEMLRAAVVREHTLGRTQVDIARRAGIDRMTVRKWLGQH